MTRHRVAMFALALCVAGDLGGVVRQVMSDDRPPVLATILGGLFALLSAAAIAGLAGGATWSRGLGLISRGGDALLLVGALIGGGFAGEPLSHTAPAGLQFLLSAAAVVALMRLRGQPADLADGAPGSSVPPGAEL